MVDQKAISLKSPPDCWRFIEETRSCEAPVPLPADVHAVFTRTPHIELQDAIPGPRFVVHVSRPQAQAMQLWLHSVYECLKHDDNRRLNCLLCISRVAVALMLSER
jgi:hypothetical protein